MLQTQCSARPFVCELRRKKIRRVPPYQPNRKRGIAAACGGPHALRMLNGRTGKEIWSLYETSALHPDVALTGRVAPPDTPPDVDEVMREIDDVRLEHEARERQKAQLPP